MSDTMLTPIPRGPYAFSILSFKLDIGSYSSENVNSIAASF